MIEISYRLDIMGMQSKKEAGRHIKRTETVHRGAATQR